MESALLALKMDNPKVIETVLQKGLKYLNTNSIKGQVYNTAYWPIIGADAKIDRNVIYRQ